jgi:two-component system NtrC family sensor kinase
MYDRMKHLFRFNFRAKMILSYLTLVMFMGLCSIIVGLYVINQNIVRHAFDVVESSLSATRRIYEEKIHIKHRALNYLAETRDFARSLDSGDRNLIYNKLMEMSRIFNFDILNVCDSNGKILVRSRNFGSYGDDLSGDPFVEYVLKNKKSCYGTGVMSAEELRGEWSELQRRASIDVAAADGVGSYRLDQGMVLKSAAPVIYNGKIVGVITGSILLNNNEEIIDLFRALVFKNEKINDVDVGTATIFYKDVRIATNVKKAGGQRAVGTRVSDEVYKHVFHGGKVWLDRALVVDRWYLSGYAPIFDLNNKPIGILYVGILQEKYDRIQRSTTFYFLTIIILAGALAVLFSIYILMSITRPAKVLINASREIIRGNYQKIEIETMDEMGYLCHVFNNMVDAITDRDRLLKEHTEKKIQQSEKLASLGRLASGIAHEINNPLTAVLTYSSLMLEDLEHTEFKEDLLVIRNETLRCREIVKGILDFARETRLEKSMVNLNDIVSDTLMILDKHVSFQNIEIVRETDPDIPDMPLDINQMKSVINNLALNAADAMVGGGVLTITTLYDREKNKIILRVKDTGTGISEENLTRVFDPFFTTKETGKGTGLGLAVTYGIIERHNGAIDITSRQGHGTEIRIELPAPPPEDNEVRG